MYVCMLFFIYVLYLIIGLNIHLNKNIYNTFKISIYNTFIKTTQTKLSRSTTYLSLTDMSLHVGMCYYEVKSFLS